MTGNPKLRIVQWNCRSITGRCDHLQRHIREFAPDVLMLQSLHVAKRQLPRLPGFHYPPVYGAEGGRVMVATYLSDRLQYRDRASPAIAPADCRLTTCAVDVVQREKRPLTLVNVYYPAGSQKHDHVGWMSGLEDSCDWLVAGDFNVHHKSWDPGCDPSSGFHLAQTIADSDLIILNDGSITRISDTPARRSTAIDLTLASSKVAAQIDWSCTDETLSSDHVAIHIDVNAFDSAEVELDNAPKFNFAKANWPAFQKGLDTACQSVDMSDPDIEICLENLRRMVLTVAESTIPKRGPPGSRRLGPNTEWWTEACGVAVARKRYLLGVFKRNLTVENQQAYLAAKTECEAIILKAKQDSWEKFCTEEIVSPTDAPKVWNRLRKFKLQFRRQEKPLLVDGTWTRTSRDKAEALASTFAKASQTAHLPDDMLRARQAAERDFRDASSTLSFDTPLDTDLTLAELEAAVASLGCASKASGADPITYQMIKRFPMSMKRLVLSLYQRCWESGSVPATWRTAVVVAIPKDGKPLAEASSYRPIALTPHLGKVYERILKNRLEHFLDTKKVLPLNQAGFRKGRNCMEQVVRLVEHVKKAWVNRDTTLATFFDIRRAFDTVWHEKLLQKLAKIGVGGRLYNFVRAFLSDRKMSVKVGSHLSQSHTLDMGVPQGSVIAPTLFCIMLYDVLDPLKEEGVHVSLYADDMALWADFTGRYRVGMKHWRTWYQSVVDRVSGYMRENGFALNPDKTVLMAFTRRHGSIRPEELSINLEGKTIYSSKSAKFLGVTLQSNLGWKTHLQTLAAKAMRSVNLIKLLSGEKWATPSSLVHLCGALVRSRLTYGHEVFFAAAKTYWELLERVERKALKAALWLPLRAVNDMVYQTAGWLPLKRECEVLSAKSVVRLALTRNSMSDKLVPEPLGERANDRKTELRSMRVLGTRTETLLSHTSSLLDEANVVIGPRQAAVESPPLPSWHWERPLVIPSLAPDAKKETDVHYLAMLAREKLNEMPAHLPVYTDGSVSADGKVGCAFVVPSLGVRKSFQLNEGVSIFSAELYAIFQACVWLDGMPNPPCGAVILSDSKSVLTALAGGGTANRGDIQKEVLALSHQLITKGCDLRMMWLPSHCGIRGNEEADVAAKHGATAGLQVSLALSVRESKAKVKAAGRQRWESYLDQRCAQNGWLRLPRGQSHLPRLPRRQQTILHKIRTVCATYLLHPQTCECGENLTLHHIVMDECAPLTSAMSGVWLMRRTCGLTPVGFLVPHAKEGLVPMTLLTTAISLAPFKSAF